MHRTDVTWNETYWLHNYTGTLTTPTDKNKH